MNQGSSEIEMWDDGWTAVTKDGGRSAQFGKQPLLDSITNYRTYDSHY